MTGDSPVERPGLSAEDPVNARPGEPLADPRVSATDRLRIRRVGELQALPQ